MKKHISIIIPCYNQAHFLDQALQSVLNQTYLNWECLLINDGSTDETEIISNKWIKKDSRFKYFFKENGGLSSARNFGLDNAEGDCIVFLDSDDCIEENKLEASLNLMIKDDLDLVISDFCMFYTNPLKRKAPFCNLKNQNFSLKSIVLNWDSEYTIPIHCGFFNSSLFENIRFSEDLKAKEDWMMWIDVFKLNPKVSYIDKVFALYRKNPKSMTSNLSFMRANTDKFFLKIYPTLSSELQPLFLEKVFRDNSNSIIYYQKKYLKYKKLMYLFINIIILLVIMISYITQKI
jgi:glycosyltransferase involved in cell wall biosynthesis